MEVKSLKAEIRKPGGSREAARLRRAGRVPGVIYGHKQAAASIALDPKLLEREIEHGAHLFTIEMGGKNETCLLKDVQYDHLGLHAMHVDFIRVDLNERVKVKVPLELRGTAKGVADGGVVTQLMMDIEIECQVAAIPDNIRVNIADLALNQMIHVRELPLPAGFKALGDAEAIVVMCREPLAAVEAVAPVEGATAAEPEVIAKGKAPEEGAEGAAEEKKK